MEELESTLVNRIVRGTPPTLNDIDDALSIADEALESYKRLEMLADWLRAMRTYYDEADIT